MNRCQCPKCNQPVEPDSIDAKLCIKCDMEGCQPVQGEKQETKEKQP